jgi:hypothetical protein
MATLDSTRRNLLDIGAILFVGIAVRCLYLLNAGSWPITFGDSRVYLRAAQSFFVSDYSNFWRVAGQKGPGYPIFLAAAAKAFGPSLTGLDVPLLGRLQSNGQEVWFWGIRLLQVLMGAGTAVLVYVIGLTIDRNQGRRIGLVSASLFALYPNQILYTGYLTSEVFAIFLFWLAIAVLYAVRLRQRAAGFYSVAGCLLAAACLTRPSLVPASAAVSLAVLIGRNGPLWGRRGWYALSFSLSLFALLISWNLLATRHNPNVIIGRGGFGDRLRTLVKAIAPVTYEWTNDRYGWADNRMPEPDPDVRWTGEGGAIPGGAVARWPIPPEVASRIAGQKAHVVVSAHAREAGRAVQFEAALSAGTEGDSGLRRFTTMTAVEGFTFDYDVPLVPLGNALALVIANGKADLTIDGVAMTRARSPLSLPELFRSSPRILNLIFCNFWFADDFGRSGNVVPRFWVEFLQQTVLLLSFAGLGFALMEWRSWALIFAVIIAQIPITVGWTEPRENMPIMPALFLLSALFLTALPLWLKQFNRPGGRRYLAASAVLLAPFLLRAISWAGVASSLAGRAGDVAIFPALASFALLFWWLEADPERSRVPVAVAAIVPMLILALGLGAYLWVGAVPRWHYSRTDLCANRLVPTQRISLGRPIAVDDVDSAEVLLDIETPRTTLLPLGLRLNGTMLPSSADSWLSHFPVVVDDPRLGSGAYKWQVYQEFADFFGRPLTSWPQWWGMPFDPALLRGARDLSIAVDVAPAGCEQPILLGVTHDAQTPGMRTGPSITNTSLYRWHIIDDWRFWETSPIGSLATQSILSSGPSSSPSNEARGTPFDGEFGIRLLIRYKDGDLEIF